MDWNWYRELTFRQQDSLTAWHFLAMQKNKLSLISCEHRNWKQHNNFYFKLKYNEIYVKVIYSDRVTWILWNYWEFLVTILFHWSIVTNSHALIRHHGWSSNIFTVTTDKNMSHLQHKTVSWLILMLKNNFYLNITVIK